MQYISKMEVMIENNERMIDMMCNGQVYQSKERTAAEITALNMSKRNRNLLKTSAHA